MRQEKNIWKCQAGNFCGFEADGCYHVQGIRYASSERFCPPVPFVYPAGVHNLVAPSPWAVQPPSEIEFFLAGTDYSTLPQEENCQYLSITVPTEGCGCYPVMVWLHGGSYINGGCDNPGYSRAALSREQKVVVVGVNSRLGVFGFGRGCNGSFANNGLLDVIEALRWIQDNIRSFGGDPESVTIFGQSSGADLVRCILLSEGTERLYSRAILQSPPIGAVYYRERVDQRMQKALCAIPVDAPTQHVLAMQQRIKRRSALLGYARFLPFTPCFGTFPLPAVKDIPWRLQNVAPRHAIMIGCNAREASAYVAKNNFLASLCHVPLTSKLVELALRKVGQDIFETPAKDFARQYAEAGGKTHLYSFFWRENNSFLGACHGQELLLLFGGRGMSGRPIAMGLTEEEILEKGRAVRALWGGFARNGMLPEGGIEGVMSLEIWHGKKQHDGFCLKFKPPLFKRLTDGKRCFPVNCCRR